MKLKEIVPWGRSFDEYRRMFALTDPDLARSILGCGDGPASFNAELTARGGQVVSVDPLYRFGADEIQQRVAETARMVINEVERQRDQFIWEEIPSPSALLQVRMDAMTRFLKDYETGRSSLRYIPAALPSLPFGSDRFSLVLCSHLLFTYSELLSEDLHHAAILEMLRVGREVRIFPLLTLDGRLSPYLDRLGDRLGQSGFVARRERVPYQFQRGGNEMLRIVRAGGAGV